MTTRAVLVAAGYGTRFLPFTRVVPKELLPIDGRPAIQLVVEELAEAGITDLLVITQRRKGALDDYFDHDPELEAAVSSDAHKLRQAQPPSGLRVTYVRQQQMRGTGDAIRLARDFARGEPVVVAFPDDVFGHPNPTAQLIEAHAATGASVLGAIDLGDADPSAYGILDAHWDGQVWRVRQVVEKPRAHHAPSNLASVGRFLYTPALLDAVANTVDDDGPGEQTPMEAFAAHGLTNRLVATVVKAPRWDLGRPGGWARCVVDHMLAHPTEGEAFHRWLRHRLRGDPAP